MTKHCECTFRARNPNSNFLPIESAKKQRAASSTHTSTPQSLVHLPESDDVDNEQPRPCSYHVNHLEFLLRSVLAKKTRTSLGNPTAKKTAEQVIKYSDKVFHQAVIEWLIATDQVRLGYPLDMV